MSEIPKHPGKRPPKNNLAATAEWALAVAENRDAVAKVAVEALAEVVGCPNLTGLGPRGIAKAALAKIEASGWRP